MLTLLAMAAHAQQTQPVGGFDPNALLPERGADPSTEPGMGEFDPNSIEPVPNGVQRQQAAYFDALELRRGLQFGYHYDSNVAQLGKGVPLPAHEDQHGDAVFGLAADLNAILHFGYEAPDARRSQSLAVGFGADTFHGWHHNWSTEDRNVFGGQAFFNWGFLLLPGEGPDFYFGVGYDYDHVRRDRDAYVDVHTVSPTLTFVWKRDDNDIRWDNETTRSMLYFDMSWRDYHEAVRIRRLERDGRYSTVGLRHVHDLAQLKGLPWLRDYVDGLKKAHQGDPHYLHEQLLGHIGYAYQKADTTGREFDGIGHELSAGLHVPLPWYLTLDLDGAWNWSDYEHRSYYDIHRRAQRGFGQRYSLGLTRTWTQFATGSELVELKLGLVAGLELDDANIVARFGNPYDRERWFAGVMFSVDWIPLAKDWHNNVPTGSSRTLPGAGGIREATSRVRKSLSSQSGPINTPTRAPLLQILGATGGGSGVTQ
jgi:hypothetical protein